MYSMIDGPSSIDGPVREQELDTKKRAVYAVAYISGSVEITRDVLDALGLLNDLQLVRKSSRP